MLNWAVALGISILRYVLDSDTVFQGARRPALRGRGNTTLLTGVEPSPARLSECGANSESPI